MRLRSNRNTLFCFSPPVMIATFIIEISLAVYALWRYKLTAVTRLAAVLLVSLAAFQLAEYMVCQELGNAQFWSRLGFVAITVLPPVGFHLLQVISGASSRWLALPGYLIGAGFVSFFALAPNAITGNQCMGNYVIFQVGHSAGGWYGAYYYALLGAILLYGWYQLRQKHPKRQQRAIGALMAGYAIFLIPTTAAALANTEVLSAIPSVMCGFAVLLAVTLGWLVLPAVSKPRKKKS